MSISETFKEFLKNLAVDNSEAISIRYCELTRALNKKFRDTESETSNSLQVGSYGRWTAIKGISDLDMLYIMPKSAWETYRNAGQSDLLTDAATAIKARYPKTDVRVDRLVVRVMYNSFHVEVQPVFEQNDGSFLYPDTYNGGSWKTTKPKEEISAMSEFDEQKNKNLRRLCKMARAWKNKHGVAIGGLLIDTLVYNFLISTDKYDGKSYLYYDFMSRDFFLYLSELPDQDYFAALGCGQRVKVKKKFQGKAAKAYDLCKKAISSEGLDNQNEKWRAVYGRAFPASVKVVKAALVENRVRKRALLVPRKRLKFHVVSKNIPKSYTLFWKVLNRGDEAIRRDCVRGQIVPDKGHEEVIEQTSFRGDHVVECYAVINDVVVAKDRIHVPINSNIEDSDG
jgi:hypothetical protein